MTEPIDDEHAIRELEALEARIDALESRGAIEDLHARFVRAVADRRFTELVDYFHPDASIDMRTHGVKTGAAAIAEHFEFMVTVPLQGASYLLSSPVVEVEGDRAHGVWTWHRFFSSAEISGRPVRVWGIWEEGRYDCDYSRVDGAWRFSRMRFRVVRPDPDPEGPLAPVEGSR